MRRPTAKDAGSPNRRPSPSCDGRLANTDGSRVTSWRSGIGCGHSSVAIQTYSPIGLWGQRADDGSRMSREAHVRFWESAGQRSPAPLAFLGFSYGFRPGRGPHDALDALVVGITSRKVNYILDADIRSFFASVSQEWLVRFPKHRIGDKRIIRLIQKWLRAGILEDGIVRWLTREPGKVQWPRRCLPASTCTTSWTCEANAGDGRRLPAT